MDSNSTAIDDPSQNQPSEGPDDAFDDVVASTTSDLPIQITNAISLAACLAVVISYFLFRRKNKRIMERTSLILAVSMASTDLLLHAINLFGYSDLPKNFICSFFGGFLYAFPTLTSLFYSFCIALNTQLVFVFGKRPGASKLKYYICIPIFLSLCICVPALGAGLYGYDASFDMCWYKTEGKTSRQVLIPYFFTFAFWCLLTVLYLIIAALTILVAIFSKSSRPQPSHQQPYPVSLFVPFASEAIRPFTISTPFLLARTGLVFCCVVPVGTRRRKAKLVGDDDQLDPQTYRISCPAQ